MNTKHNSQDNNLKDLDEIFKDIVEVKIYLKNGKSISFSTNAFRDKFLGISSLLSSREKEISGLKIEHDIDCNFGKGEQTDDCVCSANAYNSGIDDVLKILK